jgi:hypothetical protein
MPRLTEEGVAQLAEVDHASIGNAPPQSVRDEPSESSLPEMIPFHDRGFSVATQTTAIESVTETSQGTESDLNNLVHQRSDSADVIRVAVHDNTRMDSGNDILASLRASNISVEAMPSIDSVVDSDSDSHILSNPSASILHSSRSSVLESRISSDEESQILSLTEEGVVALEEIDHASIGNVPPRSVRDESISESSMVGRGQHSSRSFTMFRDPSSGLGDTVTANASIEAMPSVDSVHSMSQDSVDAMPSEYNGNSLHEESSETEDLMTSHTSDMASSTSLEALPSVDLGSELEEEPFTTFVQAESTGTEDEDLVVYQASDPEASSTSIEALPSDDDLSSVHEHDAHLPYLDTNHVDHGNTLLNGLNHDHFMQGYSVANHNGTERTALLPISQINFNNDRNGIAQSNPKGSWNGEFIYVHELIA